MNNNIPSTAAERVLGLIKGDILEGTIPPGSKLKILQLAARYDTGATPVREALSQLAATGLLRQQGQRGFSIPPLSERGWTDLLRTRTLLECEALRLAMANPSTGWEDNIVSSYYLFVLEIERLYDKRVHSIQKYWMRHNEFHRALVETCPLKTLKGFLYDIYLRMTPYRRLTGTEGYSQELLIKEHSSLKDAVLSGDVDAATGAMQRHVETNTAIICSNLAALRQG